MCSKQVCISKDDALKGFSAIGLSSDESDALVDFDKFRDFSCVVFRAAGHKSPVIIHSDGTAVTVDGREIQCRPQVLRIIQCLRSGQFVKRESIRSSVWPGRVVTDNAFDVAIHRASLTLSEYNLIIERTYIGYRLFAAG